MKKGDLLYVTEGTHDEYQVLGVFRALRDIEQRDLLRAFSPHEPERWHEDGIPSHNFTTWAVAEGYLEPVEATEFHIGDYGCLEKRALCDHKGAKAVQLDGRSRYLPERNGSGYFCEHCKAVSKTGDFTDYRDFDELDVGAD